MKKSLLLKYIIGAAVFAAYCTLFLSLNSCEKNETHPLAPVVGGCDTTSVSYSAVILPIFQKACTGCHSGGAAPKGIDLSSYSSTKAAYDNGSLTNGVANTMTSYFKTTCDFEKVMAWINKGAPND